MRLTLIHNPSAGSGRASADALRAALRAAGYDVAYQSTEAGDPAPALAWPAELVLAAGGDGTVADTARHLVGRDVPLAILPLGTANNIARSLGVHGSVRDVIAGLRADRLATLARRRLDVGTARAPWGVARFVESVGVGLLGAMLREPAGAARGEAPGGGSTMERVAEGRRRLRRVLGRTRARAWRVEADGDDVSGEYSMVEVVSTRHVGPRVALGAADGHGDGTLHLVLLRETDHRAFDAYLARDPRAGDDPAPVSMRRVRRVRIGWDAAVGHLDDEPWPGASGAQEDGDAPVDVAIDDPPLAVVVPAGR